MAKKEQPQGQTKEWCERLAAMQGGYFYPWKAELPPFNGEDTYWDLLCQHLSPEADVLEAGCGHGVDALNIAPRCKSLLAYDRVQPYLDIAAEAARKAGAGNIRWVCADSSANSNGGRVKIPAATASADLVVSRRGPTNWIEDAPRVCRPGAVLLQLNPNGMPLPPWNDELPQDLRISPPDPKDPPVLQTVEKRLSLAGLQLDSAWTFDVPMRFADGEQLYLFLGFGRAPGEVPAYDEARPALDGVFARHAGPKGLEVRRRRLLWKAVVA